MTPDRQESERAQYLLEIGEYNLAACRVLDADHDAVDEEPDDPTGTCSICPYADGWREDSPDKFNHYTMADVAEVTAWVKERQGT